MHKILFICHGNICRSTMAQFVMTDLVTKAGLQSRFQIDSKATSTEEIGNPPHPGTLRKMKEEGIPVFNHRAVQMSHADYENYDYIIGMDRWNIRNIMSILKTDPQKKVYMLLDFTDNPAEIDDPWYTHDFDATYRDVSLGCRALLSFLISKD